MKKMWLRGAEDNTDLYAAFRGSFCSDTERELPFAVSGCSWYRVFVNGIELTEGPDRMRIRFTKKSPAASGREKISFLPSCTASVFRPGF